MAKDRSGNAGGEELIARVDSIESALSRLGREVRTRRLAVLDTEGRERLRAEVTDGVLELQLLVSGKGSGNDGLLLFAVPAVEEMPPGCGLQLWSGGEIVGELEWWGD